MIPIYRDYSGKAGSIRWVDFHSYRWMRPDYATVVEQVASQFYPFWFQMENSTDRALVPPPPQTFLLPAIPCLGDSQLSETRFTTDLGTFQDRPELNGLGHFTLAQDRADAWIMHLQGSNGQLSLLTRIDPSQPQITDPEVFFTQLTQLRDWAVQLMNQALHRNETINPGEPYDVPDRYLRAVLLGRLRRQRKKAPPVFITPDLNIHPACCDQELDPHLEGAFMSHEQILRYWRHTGSLDHLSREFGLDKSQLRKTAQASRMLERLAQ